MATHSSILAWKIPWIEEPGGLRSKGSHRVRHDSATHTHTHTHTQTRDLEIDDIAFHPVNCITLALKSLRGKGKKMEDIFHLFTLFCSFYSVQINYQKN